MPVYNFRHQTQSAGNPAQPFPIGLQLAGPVLPVQVEVPSALADQLQQAGHAPPNPMPGFALIDTGASVSAVDADVISRLGVQPVGVATVLTPSGQDRQATFPARLVFPGTNIPPIEFNHLLGSNLATQTVPGHQGPLIVLLGRDILRHFVLIYNGTDGAFSLSF